MEYIGFFLQCLFLLKSKDFKCIIICANVEKVDYEPLFLSKICDFAANYPIICSHFIERIVEQNDVSFCLSRQNGFAKQPLLFRHSIFVIMICEYRKRCNKHLFLRKIINFAANYPIICSHFIERIVEQNDVSFCLSRQNGFAKQPLLFRHSTIVIIVVIQKFKSRRKK